MRKLLFSCACLAGTILPIGNTGAAEPLSPAELAVQMPPVRMLGGHVALRTEHCRVLVLQVGDEGGCVLLVQPESPEYSARVSRVARCLSELLFAERQEPEFISAGAGKLVLPGKMRRQMEDSVCTGCSGGQMLVSLITGGEWFHVTLNERGGVVLRASDDEASPGLMFYPATQKLEVMEVVGRLSGRSDIAAVTGALGYGDDASRSTRERLSRNLNCRVLFYNSDDKALMAEIRGHVYIGQRDAVRRVIEGGKVPRAVMRFPEEMATLPKVVIPPPPPMPGAEEALESYLKYLREY